MNSILGVFGAVNRVFPADPARCCDEIAELLSRQEQGADIAVLPTLALSSAGCGNLFSCASLLESAEAQLDRLLALSRELGGFFIAGLPMADCAGAVSAVAVMRDGELAGLLADADPPDGLGGVYSERFLPSDTVFRCGELRFCVSAGHPGRLPLRAAALAATGADLIVAPSYAPVTAGSTARWLEAARVASRSLGMAVLSVNGGVGDSSSPDLYRGYVALYECGETLCELVAGPDGETPSASRDLDLDVIRSQKVVSGYRPPHFSAPAAGGRRGLLRPLSLSPFVPEEAAAREGWLDELFDLQVRSLAARLENARIRRCVLGISGGLDSTLALLVASAALDRLELPRKNLVCVTMPGFGTSDRTYFNALGLMEALGVESMDVPIRAAVTQHFEDIGHDPAVRDVVYENAQARERSQILFDLANGLGGLVVGTGDLSEAALGWSTFGGDHLAGYNVNICVPKTVVRLMVGRLAERAPFARAAEFLNDVLATPVSPELLPAEASGDIAQRTEDILGAYELHDYFLYHFVRYGFRPAKLYFYACAAFAGRYEPREIKERLTVFFRRFIGGQFKRSCAPDSARLLEVCLHGSVYRFPSDLDARFLLQELEHIDF